MGAGRTPQAKDFQRLRSLASPPKTISVWLSQLFPTSSAFAKRRRPRDVARLQKNLDDFEQDLKEHAMQVQMKLSYILNALDESAAADQGGGASVGDGASCGGLTGGGGGGAGCWAGLAHSGTTDGGGGSRGAAGAGIAKC